MSRYAQARRRNPKDREIPKFIEDEEKFHEYEKEIQYKNGELNGKHWVIIIIGSAILIYFLMYLNNRLPIPVEPNKENTIFSEIRAKPILQKLSNIGPKPSGSVACEKDTVNIILDELNTIKSFVENGDHSLDIQTQYPSGCFDIPRFDTDGFGICYKNVSNIIARLGAKNRKWHDEHSAVLINCHYDSWPTSYGGSDDLISCALMLELIRVLGEPRQPTVAHDVIFLFNGAEESSLLAAHGFITQHPWRHAIKAFINLEAAGSGGKELLFQAGPANQWLLNSYLDAAIHPHCSVFGQEVFQSGMYPGDTDFRVFRDHGRIPGLDLAFVRNNYWWHTEFDTAELITNGSLQRAGENVLSTLKHLLKSPYLEKSAEYGDKKFIFFDFFGFFTVVYSWEIALVLNYATIFATGTLISWRIFSFHEGNTKVGYTKTHLYYAFLTHFLCVVVIFLTLYALQSTYNTLELQMAWYSRHWIVIPQYIVPMLYAGFGAYAFFALRGIQQAEIKFVEKSLHDTNICINAILLLFITYKGIASGFIFMILALFPLLRDPVYFSIRKLFKIQDTIFTFSFFHILYVAPGILVLFYTVEMLLGIFIPIMGRTPGNSEILIGGFCAVLCLFTSFAFSVLIVKTSRKSLKRLLIIGFSIVIISQTIVSIYGTPYNYDPEYPTARRTQVYHMNRVLYDKNDNSYVNDNGILVISQDNRGVMDIPYVGEKNSGFVPILCYTNSIYCDLPYYFPTTHRIMDKLIRYKPVAEKLNLKYPAKINLTNKKTIENRVRYEFNLQGSGQLNFYITPDETYKIYGWKLKNGEKFISNSTFGFFTCAEEACGNCDIIIELETICPNQSSTEKKLFLTVVSHNLHGPDMQSTTLKILLSKILDKRRNPENWQWAMTTSAWTVDLLGKYF